MNKYARYRLKCRSEGRCPHCGEPCAPYAECNDRRRGKKLHRILDRAAKAGAITKIKQPDGRVKWKIDANAMDRHWPKGNQSGRPGDRRTLPKIGAKPTQAGSLIRWLALDLAKRNGGTVTETQIEKAFGDVRVRHARKSPRVASTGEA